MKTTVTNNSPTQVLISLSADEKEITQAKNVTLKRLGKSLKVKGFREGTAPLSVIEQNIDRELFINEFLDDIMSRLYAEAITANNLRPVTRPKAEVKKFVPFTELEFSVETEVIPPITLGDYKKITIKKDVAKVTTEQISEVIENLRTRLAKKEDVDRAAKDGDQAWIDFEGTDSEGKPVNGASGKDYPLGLGSNTFIPGFEENLIGLKAGEEKTFTVKFPKDYGVAALQSKDVTFKVNVTKVQAVVKPKIDDDLAKEAGNFSSVAELKADVKKQLESEQEVELTRKLQNDIIEAIVEKSTVEVPASVIESYKGEILRDFTQNLTYRGMTYPEFLESTKQTEEEHLTKEILPIAEKRAKAGLIMSEIADKEKLMVTPEELEIRMSLLRGQFKDEQMQKQLETDEARREIAAQILNEKTVARLVELCTK